MKLCFDTVEELKAFVKDHLKTKRTGKDDADEGAATGGQAPPPMQPPAGAFNPSGFAPPATGAAQAGAGPFAAAVTGPAPEVLALAQRIATRADGLIAAGQDANAMLTWFRGQCGPEAANATLDQIKASFLPRASVPTLESIVKLMGA